jgi:hypothetical protein
MILENRCLLSAQSLRDVLPLLLSKHNPVERVIKSHVVVEYTGILRQHINVLAKCTEGATVKAVRVNSAIYIRASSVDRMVNVVCSAIEQSVRSPGNDHSIWINKDQV